VQRGLLNAKRKLPRILITHPARQHSHQAATALYQAGMLGCYATGVPVSSEGFGALGKRLLNKYSVLEAVNVPKEITRVNMVAPITNRILVRHFPESIIGPLQYETYRLFDRWAARLLRQGRFDAVVGYENSALVTFREARRLGIKCILDAAALHHVEQDRHYKSRLPTHYKSRVDRLKDIEVNLADCVFTASALATHSYTSNIDFGKNVKTILLGVDIERFKPKDRRRKRNEPFVFAFVGSGNEIKGFDFVLDALETLYWEGVVCTLLVAGIVDRSLLSRVDNKVFGNIRECGMVTQTKLVDILNSADCLLLPSRHDSFGMVVVEAMACGLPVIVSEMVGAKELIKEGKNGFVVPVGNQLALVDRMRWLTGNREALAKMSLEARTTAEQTSWEKYRERFVAAIREVLSSS
jgi:glycosyltransferase involved in cell wall biosynthesis